MADRSVLVTGAAGGLGVAVAEAFRADGWRVVAPVRGTDEVSGAVTVTGVDLADPTAVAGVASVAAAEAGAPLRAVVNLVGGYGGGALVHELPLADFERQIARVVRFLAGDESAPTSGASIPVYGRA